MAFAMPNAYQKDNYGESTEGIAGTGTNNLQTALNRLVTPSGTIVLRTIDPRTSEPLQLTESQQRHISKQLAKEIAAAPANRATTISFTLGKGKVHDVQVESHEGKPEAYRAAYDRASSSRMVMLVAPLSGRRTMNTMDLTVSVDDLFGDDWDDEAVEVVA